MNSDIHLLFSRIMHITLTISIVLISYLLGSIVAAVFVSRIFYGKDIRTLGSKNAGSSNMFEELGFVAGAFTQVIDIGKGALAASLPNLINIYVGEQPAHSDYYYLQHFSLESQSIICGSIAVIGHIWPVFAGFKGGKGINTLLGMMLVANPLAAGISLLVWVICLYITSYIAIASIVAVIAYPVWIIFKDVFTTGILDFAVIGAGIGMGILVIYTHRSNIYRLLKGEEGKSWWLRKKPLSR